MSEFDVCREAVRNLVDEYAEAEKDSYLTWVPPPRGTKTKKKVHPKLQQRLTKNFAVAGLSAGAAAGAMAAAS
jgi:hypothetical protein